MRTVILLGYDILLLLEFPFAQVVKFYKNTQAGLCSISMSYFDSSDVRRGTTVPWYHYETVMLKTNVYGGYSRYLAMNYSDDIPSINKCSIVCPNTPTQWINYSLGVPMTNELSSRGSCCKIGQRSCTNIHKKKWKRLVWHTNMETNVLKMSSNNKIR